jgi:outer membrane protein assembly factor BamB
MFLKLGKRFMAVIVVFMLYPAHTIAEHPESAQADPVPWNQWRGPNRDGLLPASTTWPVSIDSNRVSELWRFPLGPSYSGPLVVGDRVYVTETVDKKDERVRCIDRTTADEIWSQSWKGAMRVPFFAAANGSWIRSTPALSNGRLFVAGIRGLLVCLDENDGSEIWRKDFPVEMSAPIPQFGCVCSPLVDGNFVYMQAGGAMHKLDQATGKSIWKSALDGQGKNSSVFSSPTIETIGGVRQLVVQGRTELMGIDLDSGTVLWSKTVPAFRGMSIITPTFFEDQFLISNYRHPTKMLAIEKAGKQYSVSERWQLKSRGYMTSPVIVDGHAYLLLQNERFTCIDLRTGKENWVSDRETKYASLISNGDKILALTADGYLVMLKSNPEKYEELGRCKVGSNSWAHLAIYGDQLFVRNIDALIALSWK